MAVRPNDFEALRAALEAGSDRNPGAGGPLALESLDGGLRRVGSPGPLVDNRMRDSFPIRWLLVDADDVDAGTRCSVFRRRRAPQTTTSIIDIDTDEVVRTSTSSKWAFVDVVPGHVVDVSRKLFTDVADAVLPGHTPPLTINETRASFGLPALPKLGPALGLLDEITVRCEDDGAVRVFGVPWDITASSSKHAMLGCPRRGGRAIVVGKHPHEIKEDELERLKLFITTSAG